MTSSNIASASPMPGPWELGDWITSMGDNVYRIIYSGKRAVSAISVYGRRPDGSQGGRKKKNGGYAPCISTPECEATSRLIAAAPELLEACKRLRSVVSDHVSIEDVDCLDAAIAKAEGR